MTSIFVDAVLTRSLPKTGQDTAYIDNDDGDEETQQKGWWEGKTLANNKTRFIAKTIDGDDVVIDRATGLMWAADGNGAGCGLGWNFSWDAACVQRVILGSFAGFSDWRLPNVSELFSICDLSKSDPMIDESFFPNTYSSEYWTSTTDASYTSWGIYIDFDEIDIDSATKAGQKKIRLVRGSM